MTLVFKRKEPNASAKVINDGQKYTSHYYRIVEVKPTDPNTTRQKENLVRVRKKEAYMP